jgi:hypothetical protein
VGKDMAEITLTDAQIKKILKTAVIEVLEERRDLFREAIEEALADLGMTRAIEEGLKTGNVSRRAVLDLIRENK